MGCGCASPVFRDTWPPCQHSHDSSVTDDLESCTPNPAFQLGRDLAEAGDDYAIEWNARRDLPLYQAAHVLHSRLRPRLVLQLGICVATAAPSATVHGDRQHARPVFDSQQQTDRK